MSESPAPPYTVQEPAEAYTDAASLVQTTIDVNGQSYTAYQANADTALYLVYAAAPDGSAGWYWYDPAQGTFQQDLGQFGSQGLVTALQNELTDLKESSASSLSQRLYIIIGLAVLSVVLLVLVIVFAIRSRNAEYEYYDDDEDEEPEDDEKPSRKGGLFSKRRQKEDEEDDFDDFLAAVNERRSRDKDYADEDEDYEDYQEDGEDTEEKPDLSLTANLPQIDMSAVEEVEKKAGKAKAGKETPAEDSDDDDFDIEILDLDDFNL